jgi:alpha-beta hydrolase superfamily lysophospholipase
MSGSVLFTVNMYRQDILGEEFEQTTLQMKADYEGDVCSTLVRIKTETLSSRNILYIHGFNDYFFQRELGKRFKNKGYNFYALDLRKCGRSIRAWQSPCNIRDISEYYEDIDAAVAKIYSETKSAPVFLAHSMGGLVASLYLNDRDKNTARALILNSPFFAMNTGKSTKKLIPFVSFIARWFPNIKIDKGLSSNYGNSIAKRMYGEWEFNEQWKPLAVSKLNVGWIRAINKAHSKIAKGLDIKCPILVMRSAKSYKNRFWTDEFKTADAVLNVEDILKYSSCLGKNVTNIAFDDALHDLILSSLCVREKVYEAMFEFVDKI